MLKIKLNIFLVQRVEILIQILSFLWKIYKNLERLWSKFPVLCMECAIEKMGSSMEDVSFAIAPESIESLMMFMMDRDKSSNL